MDTEKLYTIAEVSMILRVDPTTTRRWVKNGALEAIVLPHRGKRQAYRIRQSTLDELIGAKPQPTLAPVSPLVLPRYERRDGTNR